MDILRILIALFLVALPVLAQENVATIIQRSVQANERDWAASPQYDDSERDRTKDGDKTYDVTMLYGSPYQRLIAVNGQPLSPAKQKAEQKKFDHAVEERKHESPEKRSHRIAKFEAERKRDHTLLSQMSAAFDFKLVGEKTVDGRKVYVLKATPRQGYRPPNRDSGVLTGMEGMLWIDHDTFQWVKVEAHVTRPVKIVGFIAVVEPGTEFEVEKKPVSGDIWLATHFVMKSNAKVMMVFRHRGSEDDTYFNYHRAEGPQQAKRQGKIDKPK